ncbi:MAG TPA: decaprenyl-phosphate phosphoribosyltransferase [Vicinamibacterales bacterium]|nr:decaprenyl-phosphate phosphoribosyltransferase [Vicinamibacterales bacterium]
MARSTSSPVAVPGASMTRAPGRTTVANLVISLRPGQWTKNLLVFAGVLFGHRLLEPQAVAASLAAFAIFCALSGAVYLMNDIADRESDRLHPTKATRPIASGALALPTATTAAIVLAAGSIAASLWLGSMFTLVAVTYLVLQALYSGPLKHMVIVDVLTLALGFVLRAAAGAVAVDVEISHWLLVCTLLLALFIALAKRRHEIVLLAGDATGHRRILGEYSAYLLDQMIGVVAASTLVAYIFYTVSPETQEKFGTPWLGLTIPFPLYGIFRYLYLVHKREGGGSPADLLLTDRPLLVCVALWALVVTAIIYRPV